MKSQCIHVRPLATAIMTLALAAAPLYAVESSGTPYPDAQNEAAWPGKGPIRVFDWMAKTRAGFWKLREKDQGAVVFVGDALTSEWEAKLMAEGFPGLKVANRGVPGDLSRGVLFRFGEDVLDLKPRAVVLCIGTNDLTARADTADIQDNIAAILRQARQRSPAMPIVLCLVPPRDAANAPIAAGVLADLNARIARLGMGQEHVVVLDLFSPLATPEGKPAAEFFAKDRIHLAERGYRKWAELLRPALEKLGARFNCDIANLNVGRDGRVYMTSNDRNNVGQVLRLNRDGTQRRCATIGPILMNATANAQGIIGVDCVHFSKRVMLLDPAFGLIGAMIKVEGGSGASPAHVEAGPSGDFYALDDGADRIVRCRPDGVRCGTYLVPREPPGPTGQLRDFRVCEKTKTLYVHTQTGAIRCFSFDSPDWKVHCKKLWSIDSPVGWGEAHIGGGNGGFDVDEEGTLYVTDKFGETIRRYDVRAQPLAAIKLQPGGNKPAAAEPGFRRMSIYGNEVLFKRVHPTELFQRYDLRTGKLLNVASVGECQEAPHPLAPSAVPAVAMAARTLPPEHGPKPLRVLFIGNSQINCVCDIPEIVEDLSHSATAKAPLVESDEVVVGGASIEGLWTSAMVQKKIQQGGWDWIVCHEIVYSYGGNTARFREYARKFAAEARKIGARTLFYASGEVETAKARQKAMYADAAEMARQCKGRVAGGGMAWQKAWAKRPNLDFYYTDRAHPNANGYYINACVIFSALTDTSPVGLDPFRLSKEDAEFLQKAAWEQYLEDRANEKQ